MTEINSKSIPAYEITIEGDIFYVFNNVIVSYAKDGIFEELELDWIAEKGYYLQNIDPDKYDIPITPAAAALFKRALKHALPSSLTN